MTSTIERPRPARAAAGGLSRRDLIKGLAAGMPLAAILADPLLAHAAAAALETVSLTTAGGRNVKAALAVPDKTPAPALLLVHEYWGLNDQIKSVAADVARQGYLALALDLYDGRVGQTADEARKYMGEVKPDEAADTIASWVTWLDSHARGTGKVGSIGWCFGGGWSLMAGILAPVDAVVVYYGKVDRSPDTLKKLRGPVLGHFATRDGWINKDMVGKFEAAMKEAAQAYTTHWYDADHAFANPTAGRYDEADAKLAWERTLAFLEKHLG